MWNPSLYKQLTTLMNSTPFTDLLSLMTKKPNLRVVDLGCGTGELTRCLADTLPNSDVLGVDNSPEMLQEASAHARQGLRFEQTSIEEVASKDTKWDLIFSQLALHWVDDHRTLLPKLLSRIYPGGQLAVQMVVLDGHDIKKEADALACQDPFRISPWTSPMLSIEEYATILHQSGFQDITAFEKIYPDVVQDVGVVFDFATVTWMIHYLKRLPREQHEAFKEEFKKILQCKYPQKPLFFPQKRLFLAATFPAINSTQTQGVWC